MSPKKDDIQETPNLVGTPRAVAPVAEAPPDEEAEEQELARAVATTHGEQGAPKPPAPDAGGYPEGEAAPGYHAGPPPRINCEKCGHAHQAAGRQQYTECERCGAKLPAKPE